MFGPIALLMATVGAGNTGVGVEGAFGAFAVPVMRRLATLWAWLRRVFVRKVPAFWFDAAAVSYCHVVFLSSVTP